MTLEPRRRPLSLRWIASHLFVIAMVALMVNLGFWQLRRLDERRALNAETAAAMSQEPVEISGATAAAGLDDYSAVFARGRYLADAEVRVANRSSGGQPGYWLATPLELGSGDVVAVVRGWVPRRSTSAVSRPSDGEEPAAPPSGTVEVWGLAFGSVAGGKTAVTADDAVPEISRMDLERFEEASGRGVMDRWIRLRAQSPRQRGALPVPVPDPDLSDGPHLSYAFQWLFFSAGTVVVYALILRRAFGRAASPAPRHAASAPGAARDDGTRVGGNGRRGRGASSA